MWLYKKKEYKGTDIDKYVGFVYLITNLINDKKYIGKKLFFFKKFHQKNKKRKRKIIESNWQDYYGSNEELKNDIELYGKENFKREILKFCISKSECNYYELREQVIRNVLFENYYNSYIGTRIHRNHLKK